MNYDDKAKSWDDEKRIKRAQIISDEILKATGKDETHSALEFGCGTGLVSFNLQNKFKKITLVDNSKGMIDVLNEKIQQNKVDNMVAYQLDINNQEDIKDKFDVIFTSMAFHHIPDISTLLKSLYRLLNDNGILCIVDLDEEDGSFHSDEKDFDGHNGFNQDDLMCKLREIGFKDVYSHNFYHDIKVNSNKNIEYDLFLMRGRK